MKTGSMIIGYQMPEIPPHVPVTRKEATKLLVKQLNKHLKVYKFEPSRYTWLERNNVPEDEALLPGFIHDCIKESGIDDSKVAVGSEPVTVCCFWPAIIRYYHSFVLTWNGSASENPFLVRVPLTDDFTLEVPLGCTVTVDDYVLKSTLSTEQSPFVEVPA